MLLALAAAVLFVLERSGKPILSALGSGGLSQNVIAYHRASGPLASPRNRPVVVVAHYDSPREDLLAREPFAAYKPIIVKLLPFAMVAPAVIAVVRMLPVPGAAKAVLWVIAILASLVPLANGVAIIANRFVLPYTTGSVSNKSSCLLYTSDTLRALPVVEILMPGQSEFYDLEVKYADPTDIHRIPADLPEDVYAQVQDIACRAHEALGLYGISRTDVIVTEDGPVILETNNVPGMTPESLVPDEARHAGIAFCDLCAELVDLALERAGR